MASSSSSSLLKKPDTIVDSKARSSSFFRKTVCLFDWWLIKTESDYKGKRLGVAGFICREQRQAVRMFSSAAIAKRFDVFTLETSDGVSIVIKGFINKQRTADNGFPSEVFKDFVFGFPPNWENYAEQYCTIPDSSVVSGLENSPSTVQFLSEETPKKNGHVIHEDKKEVEVSEDQSHKVSENIFIQSSQVSNLNRQHADEIKDKLNVTPTVYKRYSERLRNLKVNLENPASSISLKDGINVSPTSRATTGTIDNEKVNISLGGTIQSVSKLDMSGKSPDHVLAKIRSKTKENPIKVFGLVAKNNNLNTLPVVSDPENSLVQIELGGGTVPVSSGNGLQESVGANVAEKLGDGSVKDGPQQTSKSKLGRKPQNVNAKGISQVRRKLNMSGKSPVHLSAKIRSRVKEIVVSGLAAENNTLNPLPVVSDPKKNLVQNELGGGSLHISSGNELQEPMDVNMAENLDDGSIKNGPQQTAKSKRGIKPKNVNSKAAKETDAKEESTPTSKPKRKIIFEKQVLRQSSEDKAKTIMVSSECLMHGRSRYGRLLLPTMEFWRNQIPIYDSDRTITRIEGDQAVLVPPRGSRSEPQKKRKR